MFLESRTGRPVQIARTRGVLDALRARRAARLLFCRICDAELVSQRAFADRLCSAKCADDHWVQQAAQICLRFQ